MTIFVSLRFIGNCVNFPNSFHEIEYPNKIFSDYITYYHEQFTHILMVEALEKNQGNPFFVTIIF